MWQTTCERPSEEPGCWPRADEAGARISGGLVRTGSGESRGRREHVVDEILIALGAAGAWALFAGPLLQAALELRDESTTQHSLARPVDDQPRPSAWWWVLPPVAVTLVQLHRRRLRQAQLAAMPSGDVRAEMLFSGRATAWLLVAVALLIATRESWEVGATVHMSPGGRVALILLLAVAICALAARCRVRTGTLLLRGGPSGGRLGAARAERSGS